MKKLILSFLSLVCFKTYASQYIYSDFWYAVKPTHLILKVESLQDTLAEECEEHRNTLNSFAELNADDVVFYNSLPLKKQMGSKFVSVFRLKGIIAEDSNILVKPHAALIKLNIDTYNLDLQQAQIKIFSYQPESLSALSAKADVALTPPEFKINSVLSDEMFLTINRRDIACDLINKRIQLTVSAPVEYVLSETSASKAILFTEQLGRGISSIMSKNENAYVKAAKIGLLAAKLQTSAEAAPQLIEHIFNKLFINNSLKLSSLWKFGVDNSVYLLPETDLTQTTDNILIEL